MRNKKKILMALMVAVIVIVIIITMAVYLNKSEVDYDYTKLDDGIEETSEAESQDESLCEEPDAGIEETGDNTSESCEEESDGEFVYTMLDNGTWEISDYIGETGEAIIPDNWLGRKVTRIGEGCFYLRNVSYVYIPDTVTSVGMCAFYDCDNITIAGAKNLEVIENSAFKYSIFEENFPFSDSLISIGANAFYNTQGINNVELGEKIEYIGSDAFSSFSSVEPIDITIPDTIKVIGVNALRRTKIAEELADYAICGDNILIHFPNEETVIVPEGVKVVSDTGRKRKCIIKEMYIPDTVTYICGNLIDNCSDLNIYIPSSVEGIGTKENCKFVSAEFLKYIEGLTFVVESGSYAESYAIENNINYEIVDSVQALYEAAVASE
jgi:hypothetical protein